MKNEEPARALIAGAPACPSAGMRELTQAAAIYIGIRIEDRYLNIGAWPRPMLARYVTIEIECFVREWRLALADADIPHLARAVIMELGHADRPRR
jgi:hypothetical protein